MTQAVMTRGTGQGAQIGMPAGGKTGTNQDYRNAWFVGYTADYVAGVWMGNDDGSPTKRVTGSSLPAQLWRAVMSVAERGHEARPLPGGNGGGFWSKLFGFNNRSSSPEAPSSSGSTTPVSSEGGRDPLRPVD